MTGAELILGLSVIAIVTSILYLSIGIINDDFFWNKYQFRKRYRRMRCETWRNLAITKN